jgi:hypothetical protein
MFIKRVHGDLHHDWEVNMDNIRKEVLQLIAINEKIQSAVLTGGNISDDEAMLIRQCAMELLEKVPPASRIGHKLVSGDGEARSR